MSKSHDEDLDFELTTRAHSRLVKEFYEEYARAFVLPNERETLSGFKRCLELNGSGGEALRQRFGPSREFIGVLRAVDRRIAAGMNFICFPMPAMGRLITIHSIYVFVAPEWRGGGLLRRVYRRMKAAAREYGREFQLEADVQLTLFGEQNDPFRMTVDAVRRDTEATGLNQFDRMAIWGRLGARVLSFPYVQPALSARSEPDDTLFLRVLLNNECNRPDSAFPREVDPSIVREHLRRFFGITVLKGYRDPGSLPEVEAQERVLEHLIANRLPIAAYAMPSQEVLTAWKERVNELIHGDVGHATATLGLLVGIPSTPDALASGKLV